MNRKIVGRFMPDLSDGESDDYRVWSDDYLTIDSLYLHLHWSGVRGMGHLLAPAHNPRADDEFSFVNLTH